MKISVIIPTYKPQDYLWECLISLGKQTFSKEDFEVILVLNGCTEPWKSQIEEFIACKMAHMNINFIHTEQGGVSNARNLALDVASGEYIAFIDDDDYISISYLADLFAIASKDTISLCYPLSFDDGTTNYLPFYITKDYNSSNVNNRCSWYHARRYFNGPVYKLIHRDIIGERRFDTRFSYGEDSLFMFLISNRFKWVSYTSKDVIYYRRNRLGSATFHKRSFINKLKNEWHLILNKTIIFFSCPLQYSIRFYVRSLASSVVKLMC